MQTYDSLLKRISVRGAELVRLSIERPGTVPAMREEAVGAVERLEIDL